MTPFTKAWNMLKAHPEDQMFLPLGKTPEDDREWQTNVPMGTVNPIIRRILQERADRERESGRNLAEGFNRHGSPPLPDLRIGHGEGRPIENMPPSTSMSQEPHSFEQFPPRHSPQGYLDRGMDPEELQHLPEFDTPRNQTDEYWPGETRPRPLPPKPDIRNRPTDDVDFSNPGF